MCSVASCTNMKVIVFESKLIELCNDTLKEAQNTLENQEISREEEFNSTVTKCDNKCYGNTCSMHGLTFSIRTADSHDAEKMNVKDMFNRC